MKERKHKAGYDPARYQKGNIAVLISYFGPHKGLFILDMLCALSVSAVDLLYPYISRRAMNELLPQSLYRTFFTVMGIITIAYIARACLYYVITYFGHQFGVRVEADIRQDLFDHIEDLSFEFYDQNRTGQLMSRITNDLFDITELAHHGPEDLLIASVTIVGALCVLSSIEWRLALIVALLVPLFLLTAFHFRRGMSKASRGVKQTMAGINTEIETSLSGIRTSKAFANEDIEKQRFSAANESFKTAKKSYYRQMGLFNASMEFFMSIMSVAVISAGGYFIMRGSMDFVDLITFSLYIGTFVNPIRKLANFAEVFASGFAGLSRFTELMRLNPGLKDAENAEELKRVDGALSIRNVHFAYPGEREEVLSGIDIEVAPGENIAIVGPSGGGKTTLCQLIPRFYDVGEGSIEIDGKDIRGLTQHSLRSNIGIVQQDVFLFADTIYENIRYGRRDAEPEEIYEAAKRAELFEDIAAMPDGFNTYVGERGTLLSGGQKQRISIARIFLKNPPVLILDEATSALDSITEAKIQKSFDELSKGRTTITIAHRLSTVKNADRIYLIRDGVITEQGSHRELIEAGGEYSRLVEASRLGE